MAVMVEINDAKKAAEVVTDVTTIVSNEWLKIGLADSSTPEYSTLKASSNWYFHL